MRATAIASGLLIAACAACGHAPDDAGTAGAAVAFERGALTVDEGVGSARITVRRPGSTGGEAVVRYRCVPASARTADADLSGGEIHFASSETEVGEATGMDHHLRSLGPFRGTSLG